MNGFMINFMIGFMIGFLCNLYLVIFVKKITNKKAIANCLYCKNTIKN